MLGSPWKLRSSVFPILEKLASDVLGGGVGLDTDRLVRPHPGRAYWEVGSILASPPVSRHDPIFDNPPMFVSAIRAVDLVITVQIVVYLGDEDLTAVRAGLIRPDNPLMVLHSIAREKLVDFATHGDIPYIWSVV